MPEQDSSKITAVLLFVKLLYFIYQFQTSLFNRTDGNLNQGRNLETMKSQSSPSLSLAK